MPKLQKSYITKLQGKFFLRKGIEKKPPFRYNKTKKEEKLSDNINNQISKKFNCFFAKMRKHITKPEADFLKDLLVGLIRTGDPIISKVSKSLREDIKEKNTDKRLRRNIGKKDFWKEILFSYLKINRRIIESMRYIVIDDTDIQKKYAKKMEGLCRVRDGDKKDKKRKIGNGYPLLNILGVGKDREDIISVYSELFSFKKFNMESIHTKVFEALETVFSVVKNSTHILVFDRAFDAIRVIEWLIGKGFYFVIRLREQRHLYIDGKKVGYKEWRRIPLFKEIIVDKITRKNRIKKEHYLAGIKEVSLPYSKYRKEKLWLLVMKKKRVKEKDNGFSYFLGRVPEEMPPEEAFNEMLSAYGARWKIEEFHRQIKQDFSVENVQMKRYEALRNMMTIVWTIASYFVLQRFKRLMIGIIGERMSNRKQRQYLKKEWKYIYYRIFEELNYWFTQIRFRRGVWLESNDKTNFPSLFPELEVYL